MMKIIAASLFSDGVSQSGVRCRDAPSSSSPPSSPSARLKPTSHRSCNRARLRRRFSVLVRGNLAYAVSAFCVLDLSHEEVARRCAVVDGVCRSGVRRRQAPSSAQTITQECAAPIYKARASEPSHYNSSQRKSRVFNGRATKCRGSRVRPLLPGVSCIGPAAVLMFFP